MHREIARFSATLSNRKSAIKAARSQMASVTKSVVRNKTSEGAFNRNSEDGAGSSNIEGSSS